MMMQTAAHLHHWETLITDWSDDAIQFVRYQAPKILFLIVGSYLLIFILRWLARRTVRVRALQLPSGIRSQQVLTLSTVISNVGTYVILAMAGLEVLALLGLNLEPILASAGIVGFAVGFGSQALVKDVINGFFILLDDQYGIGDVIRVAGVRGTVEGMSLRRTVLRDDDGSIHTVPNSEIRVVSNLSRDWAQLSLVVSAPYQESSERIQQLIVEVSAAFAADPQFCADLEDPPTFAGLERVGNGNADYVVLIRSRPTRQLALARELRRRIKERFEQENIPADGGTARVFLAESITPPLASNNK